MYTPKYDTCLNIIVNTYTYVCKAVIGKIHVLFENTFSTNKK